jgi:nicotinate-nucleotide adenylyltransferase
VRVGLLGGSFDPVHHGHLIAAQVLRETLGLDEVRLIPAARQPFKSDGHHAPARHRGAMVGLAVAGVPGLALERAELDREGPSYTADTLRLLRQREPDDDWTLLVGSDAARDLSRWHDAAALPTLARVVPFERSGTEGAAAVAVPAIAISSTAIRARVRAGLSIRYWVPEQVAEYIAAHRLYLDAPSRRSG